ncbi:hypothetical protein EXIGLDRAFT_835361 [Exidia glandulosa HHB12029]|uniref:Uncharacterized protein n=1 Tax=Exidia glandulosa HHB12029 TaxID=1314781 RepID=A0A165IVV6_EXIGL|nr:hypothetical protein EXIGLDRAFT_835361 [Exidia glandulosa HHB12029]
MDTPRRDSGNVTPATPTSPARRNSVVDIDWDAYDAMLQHIYTQVQSGHNDLLHDGDTVPTGVIMRMENEEYRRYPPGSPFLDSFQRAVHGLRAVIAIKVHNASVSAALSLIGPNEYSMFVGRDTRVQILDTLGDLPLADREQCAAFIRDEHALVLWAQQTSDLLPLYEDFDKLLLKLLMSHWRTQASFGFSLSEAHGGAALSRSRVASTVDVSPEQESKAAALPSAPHTPTSASPTPAIQEVRKRGWFGRKLAAEVPVDLEKGTLKHKSRPTQLFAPVYGGLATALTIFFIGCGVNVLLQEAMLDGGYLRFALLLTAPFVFCVALFFSCQLVSNVFFCFGPVKQYHENSKYYSAIAPVVDPDDPKPDLPHVTIQMPVYKESLDFVIKPSVDSLKKAMLTYARQGGTCALVICDDGLQLLSEEERQARIQFYADQGIGWTARPKHSSAPGAYSRAGRFKKASNLNSSLQICRALEVHIARLQAEDPNGPDIEERALGAALAEKNAELDEKYVKAFREKREAEGPDVEKPTEVPKIEMWGCNAKALRIGAVILIVDSDTQVPTDCLRDAALELAESPEVAIIQHESDVMQVANHWFENGIAHFTRRINRCISMGCANGEVAPFVGHNAFLRWKAVQEVAFIDPIDGVRKIWSESNVSEDFDMALRLQLKGYIIRWASYSNGGFKEGVSLTVDDELNRWQKYAYGCSELLFFPLNQWHKKGPIQPQLTKFIWSTVPLHSKLTTLSYIFSYYGIAGAVVLSVLNYILVGFTLDVDGFYVHSWEVWISCSVVFIITGNVAFTLLEYRIGKESLLRGSWLTVKWIPFFFFFFGGLSWPLTTALLSHLFSYNIQWSATVKEVELSNFFVEVPRIFKLFWRTFLMSFILIATVIIMSTSLVPVGWRVVDYAVVFPLALTAGSHVLFPIVLNPWLMIFLY